LNAYFLSYGHTTVAALALPVTLIVTVVPGYLLGDPRQILNVASVPLTTPLTMPVEV